MQNSAKATIKAASRAVVSSRITALVVVLYKAVGERNKSLSSPAIYLRVAQACDGPGVSDRQ
jgi:hypothetical protein